VLPLLPDPDCIDVEESLSSLLLVLPVLPDPDVPVLLSWEEEVDPVPDWDVISSLSFLFFLFSICFRRLKIIR
jgi:hypothetical protein